MEGNDDFSSDDEDFEAETESDEPLPESALVEENECHQKENNELYGIKTNEEDDDDDYSIEEKSVHLNDDSSENEFDYILEKEKMSENKELEEQKHQKETIISLLKELVNLMEPDSTVSETLCKSTSESKVKLITDISTKLLFYGKYNIYSCDASQLQTEIDKIAAL